MWKTDHIADMIEKPPPEMFSKRVNFKNGWQAGQVLKIQLLPESTSEDWAGNRIELLPFNNLPEEVEDKVLNERGEIFVFI